MLVIIDYRTPKEAIKQLERIADVLLFNAKDLVMTQLSGHPDIFMYQDSEHLILAPNTPTYVIDKIAQHGIEFQFGQSDIDQAKGLCTQYNCVSTERHLIHHHKHTDPLVRKLNLHKTRVHTRQAFTRCSLTALSSDHFITSDKNIEKVLVDHGLQCLFVNPELITLPGFRHGLFGGTIGIYQGAIYFNGDLDQSDPLGRCRDSIGEAGLDIICLHNGPLFDGGSIFFLNS